MEIHNFQFLKKQKYIHIFQKIIIIIIKRTTWKFVLKKNISGHSFLSIFQEKKRYVDIRIFEKKKINK